VFSRETKFRIVAYRFPPCWACGQPEPLCPPDCRAQTHYPNGEPLPPVPPIPDADWWAQARRRVDAEEAARVAALPWWRRLLNWSAPWWLNWAWPHIRLAQNIAWRVWGLLRGRSLDRARREDW